MICKEIRTKARTKKALSPSLEKEATEHIKTCKTCYDLWLVEKLAPAILKAGVEPVRETPDNHSTILFNKVRSRIREMSEQRAGSWELAIEAMRGWLAAFAVAAVILIAASLQWRQTFATNDFDRDSDELINQNPDEYLISDV